MREVEEKDRQRPTVLLVVYIWDSVLALVAILIALAPFSGGLQVGGQSIALPAAIQIVLALEGGLYAAAVIMVMISLTRHDRWVRRAQVAVLALPVGLIAASAAAEQLVHGDVGLAQLLASLLIALIDGAALFALTGPKVVAWYDHPRAMPGWVRITLGLFVVSGAASIIVELALRPG